MGDNSDSHGTLNYEQLIESSEPMDDAWRGGKGLTSRSLSIIIVESVP